MPIRAIEQDMSALVADINKTRAEIITLQGEQQDHATRLNDLLADVADLGDALGLDLDLPDALDVSDVQQDLIQQATMVLPDDVREALDQEYLHGVPRIPPLDDLDRAVVMFVGIGAILAEHFLVGMPPGIVDDLNKLNSFDARQGMVSKLFQSWEIGSENALSDREFIKLSYDQSQFETPRGFGSGNHRLLSFGHDPSLSGMLVAIMDIFRGTLTGVAWNKEDQTLGTLFTDVPKYKNEALDPTNIATGIITGVFKWLGHLMSDFASPAGIPAPGSMYALLLHNKVPGQPEADTIAEVARRMYLDGYDFRHWLSGASVPVLIEFVIGMYAWLRGVNDVTDLERDYWRKGGDTMQMSRRRSKRQALLFYTHLIATLGNAAKVGISWSTGDTVRAFSSINRLQWKWFAIRTAHFVMYSTRNTVTLEQVMHNRKNLEDTKAKLLDASHAVLYELDYADYPPFEFKLTK